MKRGDILHTRTTCEGGVNFSACALASTATPRARTKVGVRVCVSCVSNSIKMALEGCSKNSPIYISDSSPVSVHDSPVKLLTEERKRGKCRYEWHYFNTCKKICKLI